MAADGHAPLDAAPFLGVSHSLSGRAWRERPADLAIARDHERQHGLINDTGNQNR